MKRLFTSLILTFSIFLIQAEGRPLKEKDVIQLTVFGESALNQQVTIDSSGSVNFPLIGSVEVEGKNTNEVATEIKERLEAGFIKEANVSVSVVSEYEEPKKVEPKIIEKQRPAPTPLDRALPKAEPTKPISRVTVMGHVNAPGVVQFEGTSADILTIIAQVRGFTALGNPKKVSVRRVGPEAKVFKVNIEDLQRSTKQVFIHSGDTISVPKRFY